MKQRALHTIAMILLACSMQGFSAETEKASSDKAKQTAAAETAAGSGEKKAPKKTEAKTSAQKEESPEMLLRKEMEYKKKHRFDFLKQNSKNVIPNRQETVEEETIRTSTPTSVQGLTKKITAIPSSAIQPKKEKPKERLHFYDDFIMLNGDEEIQVNLIFNSAPLLDVLPSFADALGFSFLADSNLKGVVTLNIDQKMPRKDLWNTFDRMLNLGGAGVKVDGSLLRIVSLDKMSRQPDSRVNGDASGEIFYYALKNSTAKEVAVQLRPFLGINAICTELAKPNAVLVSDDRANMPKIRQVLEIIDQGGKIHWKRRVFECRNILPTKLAEELQTILPVLGFSVYLKTDRSEQPGSIQVSGIDRLQLLVASAATEEAIQEIAQWVTLLDSTSSLDQENVFVYKVRYGKADQLAKTLATIYETQGSSLSIDTTSGNSKIENITSNITNRNRTQQQNSSRNNRNSTSTTNSTSTQTDKASSIFETPVRVFADGVLNRLVVRTTARTYASIKALLNKLDIVPAQVLLQVLIVEVTLGDSTQFGVEFSTSNKVGGANSLIGVNYSNVQPGTAAGGNGAVPSGQTATENGFSWLINDPNDPANTFAYLKALAGNNQIKVVSSPQLLISSNTEASIQVGKESPILTQGVTNTSSSDNNVVSNYTYRKTGVILTITPQITSNDLIALKLQQELSTIKDADANSSIKSPTINQRVIKTSMTVANGRTMIIGGLIQESVQDNLSSIPIINSIPIIRRLLGSSDSAVERTELLMMVTGYIIDEKSQVEDMIKRYNAAVDALNDFHKTLGDAPEDPQKKLKRESNWFDDLFGFLSDDPETRRPDSKSARNK